LKARLCVTGAAAMYEYCEMNAIPVERCGKVVVATQDDELPALEALYDRGRANAVQGLELISSGRLREIEPHCIGRQAIWSPGTGIVDFSRVAAAMRDDVRQLGGVVLTRREVTGLVHDNAVVVLQTTTGDVRARRVLTCAGLQSDRLAKLSGAASEPRIVPFRGRYWQIRPERRHLVRNLIYPVPDSSLPFLGVHFTRRIGDGAVWLGPNAVLAFAREGYSRWDVDARELAEIVAFSGFRRLARKYWRPGLSEMYRDWSKRAFVASCRRFVPELDDADVVPGPSGVRAQALGVDGTLMDDFHVDAQGHVDAQFDIDLRGPQLMHVRNAPSPAATSSLAIARIIVDQWEHRD
jgi:L-2-hydroxyglutarate oxidase LhgO